MVGKPRGLYFFKRAPLRINTWSSKALLTSRAPESMTRLFRPFSMSCAVSSETSSSPFPLTASGHPCSLERPDMASTFSFVAAYTRGLRSAHAFRPASMTLTSSVIRMMPASVSSFTFEHRAPNLLASPEADFTATRSALKVRPTRSYSNVLNLWRRPSTWSLPISSVTSTAMPGRFTKVFSWRKRTVSPPIVSFLSPAPMTTGLIGGAEASASSAFPSSET